MPVVAVGVAFTALAAVGIVAFGRSRRPATAATPAFILAWERRSERRRVRSQQKARRSTSRIGVWWRTSGPVASYRDWRSARNADRALRRQIEERQRLNRHRD